MIAHGPAARGAAALVIAACAWIAGPASAGGDGEEANPLVAPGIQFALQLHNEIAAGHPGENVFLSPWSVSSVLMMAMNGASGGTLEAMRDALHAKRLTPEEWNQASAALRDSILHGDPSVELVTANSAWLRNDFRFAPAFLETNRRWFGAETVSLDVADPGSAGRVNAWVAAATRNRIPTIIDRLDPDTVLLLANAVYFKGAWRSPFARAATRPGTFHAPSGDVETPMMRAGGSWAYAEDDRAQILSMPYGRGRFAMTMVLPRAARGGGGGDGSGGGLEALMKAIDAARWDAWMSALAPRPGSVAVPRFRIEQDHSLASPLSALGMAEAFDPARADFSLMTAAGAAGAARTGARIYVKDVRHKTWVDVNEEGTEAAAASGAIMGITSAPAGEPFEFTADRPFFFAIRDLATGAILFTGSVCRPSVE